MEPQHFSLRWNNYSSHMTTAFERLRSQEELVDVTLCCEGRKIRAHKILLSSCSTYFRDVFKENPCQHPVIIFKNFKYEDLYALIEFIYQGEVNVQQQSLSSFLNTAEVLTIQGLTISNEANEAGSATTESLTSSLPNTLPIVQTENHHQQQQQNQDVPPISQRNQQIISNKTNDLLDEKINSYTVATSSIVSATPSTSLSASPSVIGVIPSGAPMLEIPSAKSTSLSNRKITSTNAPPKIRILDPLEFEPMKKRRASDLDEIVSLRGYVSTGSLNIVNNISGAEQTSNLPQQQTHEMILSDVEGPKYFKMEIPEEYIEDHCRVAAQRQQQQQQQQQTPMYSSNQNQQQHNQQIKNLQKSPIINLNSSNEQLEEEEEEEDDIDDEEDEIRGIEDLDDEMEDDDENHGNNDPLLDNDGHAIEQTSIVNEKQSTYKIIEDNDSEPELLYQSHENEVPNDDSFTSLQANKDDSMMITIDQGNQQQTQVNFSSSSSGNFNCESCTRKFSSLAAMRRHYESKHTELQIHFECTICGKTFKTKWSLSTHTSKYHRCSEEQTTKFDNIKISKSQKSMQGDTNTLNSSSSTITTIDTTTNAIKKMKNFSSGHRKRGSKIVGSKNRKISVSSASPTCSLLSSLI